MLCDGGRRSSVNCSLSSHGQMLPFSSAGVETFRSTVTQTSTLNLSSYLPASEEKHHRRLLGVDDLPGGPSPTHSTARPSRHDAELNRRRILHTARAQVAEHGAALCMTR